MADQVALTARPRAGSGKGEARALRRQGRVPAVTYGTGVEPTPVSVDARDLYHALRTDAGENAILRIDVDGTDHLALAREIQRHPVRREVLHVDFVTVSRTVKVHVEVPIHLEGDAAGADEGGVLEHALYALPIEVLPLEVPDSFTVDVSGMQIGDVIRVADVAVPDGVTVLVDADEVVASIVVPALEVPETDTAEAAEAADLEAEGATADEAEGEAEGRAEEG